jgi:osmotically-inducible protein OsmY
MTTTPVKVLTLISCLSALPLIAGLTGCARARPAPKASQGVGDNRPAQPEYKQITDSRVEDSRTAERVREALAAGVDYKYGGVKVTAANGVVRLSGLVNTSAQKATAGAVAGKVVGVKSVENNITIKN